MTRARKRLLLAGDSSALGGHPLRNVFLSYAERVGGYRTAWERQD